MIHSQIKVHQHSLGLMLLSVSLGLFVSEHVYSKGFTPRPVLSTVSHGLHPLGSIQQCDCSVTGRHCSHYE